MDADERTAFSRSPVAAEACDRFKDSSEAQEAQRKAILAAKNFRAGNQWPQQVKDQRQGSNSIQGVAQQPARPCLTIDRISQPVRQVSNVVRQSSFAIDCLPVGGGADKETAEIFKGWLRRVQNESRGDAPVEWAADGAAEGGLGWFRINSYYIDTDPAFPFDQDARLERVANSLAVYPDPHANRPTRSDMRYLLVTEDVPRDEFKRKWPKANLTALDTFRSTGDTGGWVTDKTIRTAEYWRIEYDEVRVVELNNGAAFEGAAVPSGTKKGDGATDIKRERMRFDPKVRWSKVTATEELESTDWEGTRIPFIPILGEELNVDGKTVLRGVIEPAMDAQRMVNYTFSAAVESAALAPKAPWIYAAGQIERFKAIWQNSATTNYTGLPYDPVDLNGSPIPPPQRNAVEQPIQGFVQLMMLSEEAVKATTGIFDPSLGNSSPRERSGRAIEALQGKSEFGQSNYQDNVARAMVYAGELLIELGPKLLDRPGRIIQILQLDDTPQQVMLGQAFQHANDGQPQAVNGPDGQPVTDPNMARVMSGAAKFYDLKAGKYGVTVTVGRDHTTKRQEQSAALGDLIPHLPPPMQAVLTPEFIETLDFTDSQRIADLARKSLPPELQQAVKGQTPLPPQVQQQLAQIPMMQQALAQAKQIIDTKQVEADRDLQKVKLEGTKDILLAQMNNAAKILAAHITAAKESGQAREESDLELKATGVQMAHEAYQAEADRAHEFRMAELGHQQELEAASHAAAIAPEPTAPA